MERKIVVAGAGHGGLTAAAYLAEQGFAVEVYEMKRREELGYDWHDTIDNRTFEYAGVDFDMGEASLRKHSSFFAPSLNTEVAFDTPPESREIEVERKTIYRYLLKNAEDKGAKLYFSKKVTAPLIKNGAVKGIIAGGKEVEADLVIDAAGMFSAVIQGLPKSYNLRPGFGKTTSFTPTAPTIT